MYLDGGIMSMLVLSACIPRIRRLRALWSNYSHIVMDESKKL
jgi:hypothetical protein